MITHTQHYFLLLIQPEVLGARIAATRELIRQHPEPFVFTETMQHKRSLKQSENLAWFSKTLMGHVNKIEGLEKLTFEQLSDITEDEFSNEENSMQRINKLGELKQVLHSFMDGDSCSGVLCQNRRSQHSHRARMAWDKDHIEEKTDDPSVLANQSNGEFVNEVLDEDKGIVEICPYCHDRGTNRNEELEDSKKVRKSNLYHVTILHSTVLISLATRIISLLYPFVYIRPHRSSRRCNW